MLCHKIAYKDALSAEYHMLIRNKTMHFVKHSAPIAIFMKSPRYRKRNAKRKASVEKHIKKLLKYHRIAWNGYILGEVRKN